MRIVRLLAVFLAVLALAFAPRSAEARFDAASMSGATWSTSVSSLSWSHTVSAVGDPFLVVAVATWHAAALRTATAVTYNGVALTKLDSITATLESANQDTEIWYLAAPATGTHTVAVTLSGTTSFAMGVAQSYVGIDQTTPIDSHSIGQGLVAANSFSQATTVVSSTAELVGFGWVRPTPVGTTAGANTTTRVLTNEGLFGGDANSIVVPGSRSLTWNRTGATAWPGVATLSIVNVNDSLSVSKTATWFVLGSDLHGDIAEAAAATDEVSAGNTWDVTLTETATALDFLRTLASGGGGGGGAGLFGPGEDGGGAGPSGVGGYGGAGDLFTVPRQTTPGLWGNNGTEYLCSGLGSGSGGAGGSWNDVGIGQAGGPGGWRGGGGGGGGGGRLDGGLGGLGGEGVICITYFNGVGTSTVVLTKDSGSTWTVPADWTNTNTVLLVGAGGCGGRGSNVRGGNGGEGGASVGGTDVNAWVPDQVLALSVATAAFVCAAGGPANVLVTALGDFAAAAGKNGDGSGGGISVPISGPLAGDSFFYGSSLGGLGGQYASFIDLPAGYLIYRVPFTHFY